MCFAAGIIMMGAASVGSPAYLEILSARVGKEKQGQLQGAVGAVALAAVSSGSVIHSTLFGLLSPDLRFLPFLIASISVGTGATVLARAFSEQQPPPLPLPPTLQSPAGQEKEM